MLRPRPPALSEPCRAIYQNGVVLAIDVGTTASKACAVNSKGLLLASAEAAYRRGTSVRGAFVEQFPGDWEHAAGAACRACLDALPV